MSDQPKNDDNKEEPKNTGRRNFLKVAGATAAAAAAVGASNTASADHFDDTAGRYVPPGQWWHHRSLARGWRPLRAPWRQSELANQAGGGWAHAGWLQRIFTCS